MKKLFSLFNVLLATTAFGQVDIALLPEIPEAIKKGANVIKRHEEILFEVSDIDKAKYTVHQVYTVLNPDGDRALVFHEYTNKYITLDDAEIKMYDASGKLINKYKKKDIYKQGDMSGLIVEGFHYFHELKAPSYPVTVEYRYTLNFTGTLAYPAFSVMGPDEGVQSSSFTAKVPVDLGLRYKEQEIKLAPQVRQEGSYQLYTWSVKNQSAVKKEEQSISSDRYFPSILLAPNRFKIYNTQGEMTSWKKFGEWELQLINGLDVLPDERKTFFADMVRDAKTDKEKVAAVYNYLQKNFRYVSIQLGIGGWKPFPAKFTDEKKYGDCKGLSFYMYSVLKSLGIRSHIAIINAGYNNGTDDVDFPVNNFNHMILCVPQQKDSIWLECTSQTSDFNYLGSFTENRNALLVTEHGGVLVRTPSSDPAKNKMRLFTIVKLDESGAGITSTKLSGTGDYKERLTTLLLEKKDKQKEYVVHNLGFKQPDEFAFAKSDERDYTIDLNIEKIPEFNAGSKMFLRPRINRLSAAILPTAEGRTHDFYFHSTSQIIDTTVYYLPEGFVKDALPRASNVDNEFVHYTTNYWCDEGSNKLYSVMNFSIKRNRVPAAQYPSVKKTFDEIVADGTQKIIIRRN
jgi:hypothetical protein